MAKQLPIEIILAIAEHLSKGDLVKLCLASREISKRVLPILYRHIVLRVHRRYRPTIVALLKDLGAEVEKQKKLLSSYASCVRSITFVASEDHGLETMFGLPKHVTSNVGTNEMMRLVKEAISRFTNLETFFWPFTIALETGYHVPTATNYPGELQGAVSLEEANQMWREVIRLPKLIRIYVLAENKGGAAIICSSKGIIYEGPRNEPVTEFRLLTPANTSWAVKRVKRDEQLIAPTDTSNREEIRRDGYLGMRKGDFAAYRRAMDLKDGPQRRGRIINPPFTLARAFDMSSLNIIDLRHLLPTE